MLQGHRTIAIGPLLGALDAEQRFEMIGKQKKDVRRTLDGGDWAEDAPHVIGKENVVLPQVHARSGRDGVERDDRQRELQDEDAPVDRDPDRRRVERASCCPSAA
jgi:hypothetical protein